MLKLAIALLFISRFSVRAQVFTCSSTVISSSGVLPDGATFPIIVPSNTNCTYNFQIPNGFAVEMKLSATFQSNDDAVRITDSLGARRALNHAVSPITDAIIWLSSGSAQLNVIGVSGLSTFMAKFQFTSLSSYQQTTVPTGQFFDLGQVTAGNYYTITSAKSDQVIATVGFRNSDDDDSVLRDIYVYDGDNLNTSQYIGRLANLGFQNKLSTSGKSLTLVNFYNTTSALWVIGNDASAISNYQNYVAVITSAEGSIQGTLTDGTDFGSAFTFYCTDCKEFYWTQMAFDSSRTASTGLVTIQGQSPTQGMTPLLNYYSGIYTQSQLPQHIPSNMFTLSLFMAGITLRTTTSSNANINGWNTPFDGRQGLIISPSLWTTGASPAYDHKFASTSQMRFSVDYQSLQIASTYEYASVTIDTTTVRYNNTLPNPTGFSGNGTSLQATYVGNNTQSSAIVAFRMDLLAPVAPTTTVTPLVSVTTTTQKATNAPTTTVIPGSTVTITQTGGTSAATSTVNPAITGTTTQIVDSTATSTVSPGSTVTAQTVITTTKSSASLRCFALLVLTRFL